MTILAAEALAAVGTVGASPASPQSGRAATQQPRSGEEVSASGGSAPNPDPLNPTAKDVAITPPANSVLEDSNRATYRQNWPCYNEAQIRERELFLKFAIELCGMVVQPPQGQGRKRLPLADVIGAALWKTYTMQSGRRSMGETEELTARGSLSKAPHYNSVYRYLGDPTMTPLLKKLLEFTAAPMKPYERELASDSSGFSTRVYRRWFDVRRGFQTESDFVKAHITCGTRTHVIVSAEVMLGDEAGSADAPHLLPMVASAVSRGFQVREVSADKAYLSVQNLHGLAAMGIEAFVPFKVNSKPNGTSIWERAYALFTLEKERFMSHYHRRSNVETTFFMLKTRFGAFIRSKLPTAQVNELLLKLIAHNIRCLIGAVFALGLEPRLSGGQEAK